MGLIAELKRRNVFRVGIAYLVLVWVVIQVTDTVAPTLRLPEWTLALVTWIGIIGFPFAWFFATSVMKSYSVTLIRVARSMMSYSTHRGGGG